MFCFFCFDDAVAPYVGAWIETSNETPLPYECLVAPYVGAWIETEHAIAFFKKLEVAPYVGAWIETIFALSKQKNKTCRTLRGCVD